MSVKGAPARLPSSPCEIRSNNSRCVLGFNESSPTPTCPTVPMNAKTHSAESFLRSLLCYEVLCFVYNNHLCSLVALIPVRQWSTMHLLLGAKDKRNTHSKSKTKRTYQVLRTFARSRKSSNTVFYKQQRFFFDY